MKKRRFPFFTVTFIIAILIAFGYFGYKIYKDKDAFKVIITSDYVNVREEHTIYSNQLGSVKKDKKFKVLDIYLDDSRYVWYKIEYQSKKYGWISSGRNNSTVKEINNPNGQGIEDYVEDYTKPKIKFFEEDYLVYDIDSITYDHLTIEEDSKYKITHEIYYEETPKDRVEPQYWIKYTVTDEFGNSASKTQRIVFTVEPDISKVKDFSELK